MNAIDEKKERLYIRPSIICYGHWGSLTRDVYIEPYYLKLTGRGSAKNDTIKETDGRPSIHAL